MIFKVFCVHDSKAEVYARPFLMGSKGEAIRAFQDEANDSKSQICKHAPDFTLFEIGEYNDQDGVYTMYDAKKNLGSAIDYRKVDHIARPALEVAKNAVL